MRPNLVFLGIALIVAACANAGISGGPSALPPTLPTAAPTAFGVEPTPTAVATPGSAAEPTVPPAAPLGLAGLEPTPIDAAVELLVDIHGDVGGGGRTPLLVVYRDGTVLFRGWNESGQIVPQIAGLTRDGVRQIKAEARDSGLFDASGAIGPDPEYHGGFSTFVVELRVGDQLIQRMATNSLTSANRAEGEAIIAIAERLSRFERWLPGDAWRIGPADASPFVGSDFLLKITITKQPWPGGPDDPNGPTLDLAEVDWPLGGELRRFGTVIDDVGIADVHRCGVLSLADAASVEAALRNARWEGPGLPVGEWLTTRLTSNAEGWVLGVTLLNLLPHDPRDCSADGTWF